MNNIYCFFCWFSGAKIKVLEEYPNEYEKYFHIGLTIFLTWILATISGSIAFSMIFESSKIGVAAGFLWGVFIFNIDRFITISMKKKSNELITPLITESIISAVQILLPALPRFFIAILLGIVISKPLELYIFKDSIYKYQGFIEEDIRGEKEVSIKKRYEERIKIESKKVSFLEQEHERRNKLHEKEINNINLKIQEKKKELINIREEGNKITEKLQLEYMKELDGSGGTKNRGVGKVAKAKKKLMEKEESKLKVILSEKKYEISTLETETSNLEKEHSFYSNAYLDKLSKLKLDIQSIYTKKDEEISSYVSSINQEGLLNKIESLNRAIENNNVIYWLHKIIILLIIILETSPIFIKLISSCDAYETHVDKINSIQIMQDEYYVKVFRQSLKNDLSESNKQESKFL